MTHGVSTGLARRRRRLVVAAVAGLVLTVGAGLTGTQAQAKSQPAGEAGTASAARPASGAGLATATGAPAPFATFQVNGGYVAAGVSLRNRGFGTINVTGVPIGATVHAAYLYWNILGDVEGAAFKNGVFRGTSLTGTLVGSGPGPCWPDAANGYAYRANVTGLVSGNGAYALRGFASARTDGADPWTTTSNPPLAEGASLVVVYRKASYPLTRVILASGYQMVSGGAASMTIPYGFAASNPVGWVRTTWIGGDGQNSAEPSSTFNGVAVPAVGWDGNDGPFPKYSNGNLWDTTTIGVGRFVRPGQTFATVGVSGGPDCLTWVGQVLSISLNGAADTDGDSLLDGWEINGLDANGDGVTDVPLSSYGASPVHKDLFVEMDYMGAEAACPCHLPLAADLARIRSVFATAPFANNPDGLPGVNLHLDAGAARGAAYNLGGGNLVPFDADLNPVVAQFNAIKAGNFNPLRAKAFHYMIWAHAYDNGSSSGNAFAIPNDSFVVTLGRWPGGGDSDAKVGTFVHELGHDLGQTHAGTGSQNYKPNYLSVMNYAFQVSGVPRTGGSPSYFGYSSFTAPTLNEASLNQDVGLNTAAANTYRTKWFCPGGIQTISPGTANGPLDWNCNGLLSGTVAADVNADGAHTTLAGFNNWANITYGGGAVGGGASPISAMATAKTPPPVMRELTAEEAESHRR